MTIILIILAIILVIGILRIISSPRPTFWSNVRDVFFGDMLIDLIEVIIEAIDFD